MRPRDHTRLFAELSAAYAEHSPISARLNEQAKKHLIDGGSHGLRLIQPFPPRIVDSKGAWLRDVDGHHILDFWQGHYANILGHNPEVVTEALTDALGGRFGLHTGHTDELALEVAELLCQCTGAERVRLTTSGTLATMYAILLSRAFTGRGLVMKAGGGWHGGQPWALKGIHYGRDGFQGVESAGLPPSVTESVLVTSYNDPEMLREQFRVHGDRVACLIVEPFIGVGGFIPATGEFLQTARDLTHQYGALLILDEIIAGFRFRAGNMGALYGIQPDLTTMGKVLGGGMPVSAVVGREEVMRLVSREDERKVGFSGGTFSAHPAALLAAKVMIRYLVAHEDEIYPRLTELGVKARQTIEEAFASEGILVRCTGFGNEVVPDSSMAMPHFPYDDRYDLNLPDFVQNPELCDVRFRDVVLRVAMLLEDVYTVHGLGALSIAHTEADIERLGEACRQTARRVKAHWS